MPGKGAAGATEAAEKTPSLQGLIATRQDEAALLDALEKAFDYRGDVTITRASGEQVVGYIFDRVRARSGRLADSYVRLMPVTSDDKVKIAFSDIARLEFSGKDTAQGKSFETWLKKYVEKKLAGEKASIESESLD
ncbi:MAG: hypothetical protein IBJ11_08735 [Phycisphaerales bacterium]|nr:hypothetical protein [Phycisphaerales bacterium]